MQTLARSLSLTGRRARLPLKPLLDDAIEGRKVLGSVPQITMDGIYGEDTWLNIPPDMMTITIAAIAVGIDMDDTTHCTHLLQEEIRLDENSIQTMCQCNGSTGHAIFYTFLTNIIGFSIMAPSNFTPSLMFGLMTGLVMLIAVLAASMLLPYQTV